MLRPALLTLALAFSTVPAIAQNRPLPGFGNSPADPVGERWVLPPGVTLDQTLHSQDTLDSDSCKSPEEKEARKPGGLVGLVTLCLPFRYPSNSVSNPLPQSVTIPEGLTFIPHDKKFQNGYNIRSYTFEIRPGQTIFIPMFLMCLNGTRKSNVNQPGVPYSQGPIVKTKRMQEVFDMVSKYDIPFEDATLGTVISAIGRGNESNISTAMKMLREKMAVWPEAKPN